LAISCGADGLVRGLAAWSPGCVTALDRLKPVTQGQTKPMLD